MKKFKFVFIKVIMLLMLQRTVSRTACGPCRCHDDRSYHGGIKAVCSGLNLISVPTLHRDTTTLLMDNNKFLYLPPRAFAGMKKLKHLDLSENRLRSLGEHVFNGLPYLEELILDGNYFLHKCYDVFDPVFLKPLTRLHTVSLFGFVQSCKQNPVQYSGSSFPDSLQWLYIGCINCRFESSFLRLTNLSLLSLSSSRYKWSCFINGTDNSTFLHTPYLKFLNISECRLYFAKSSIFDPLQNIRKLAMPFISQGDEFDFFIEATKSLRFSPIEYIKFVSFRSTETNPDLFLHLENTTLKELHISNTFYAHIDELTIEKLPKSLEVLTLEHFQYTAKNLSALHRYPILKALDLSYILISDFHVSVNTLPPLLETLICRRCNLHALWFNISNMTQEMTMKHVKMLVIPENGISYFSNFMAFFPHVEYIDVRHNRLDKIPPFSPNNSMNYLNVAGNLLGNFLASDDTSTLESLSKLKTVDFSNNNAFSLSTNGLDKLKNIRIINVSYNYIETVNIRLIHLSYLEVFDLRNNRINAIGEQTRNDLSRLPKAKIYLDGNPLACGCDEFDSLQWIKRNRNRVYNLKTLTCRLSSGKRESMSNLDETISNLQTLCKPNILEISVSVCVTVSILSLIASVLVYRHRWKLRYLYYAGRRGYRRRYNKDNANQEEYQYDAFISYSDPDRRFVFKEMIEELEEKYDLRLCIHHRDFLPGEVISDNIVNAIQNSRKTVVVLSPSFLKSDWCEFEFNMARMEGVTRRQDIVLMLLYEDVSMMNLSKDMAAMLKRNCYLEYNHELYNKEIFWYNVQESIQTIRHSE